MTVLVGYANARWSAKGIAQEIGAELMKSGVHASVRLLTDVGDLRYYDAVVVGSAVYGGKWHADATVFLARHQVELAERALWLFSVSAVGSRNSLFGPRLSRLIRYTRKPTPLVIDARHWPRFRGHRDFAGAVERGQWGRAGDLLLKVCGGVVGDHRDWADVDEWARSIAGQVLAAEWAEERKRLRLVPPLGAPSRTR